MNGILTLCSRQRSRRLNLRLLRRVTRTLLEDFLARPGFELGIRIVDAAEMAKVNEKFLAHQGSTDVITFGYSKPGAAPLTGDILVCIDEAVAQARRFRTSWQSELVRYVVHGALHLCGFDDQTPAARRKMKIQENRLLAKLARRFPFTRLSWPLGKRPPPPHPARRRPF